MSAELVLPNAPKCETVGCDHHEKPVTSRDHYQRFGRTSMGSARFRCKACRRVVTFSASPIKRQRDPSKNRIILSLLMNKSPMRRICEVADIRPKTLYQRISFFHEQCRRFVATHEQAFFENGFRHARAYVCVDRQDYLVNWSNQDDRRNVRLHAVASADQRSGYVFGVHLDFDATLNAVAVEADHAAHPELHVSHPFRRYARVWLQADYRDAIRTHQRRKASQQTRKWKLSQEGAGVISDVAAAYEDTMHREDVEQSALPDVDTQLPAHGMQIHTEYTLYGHMFYLERMLKGFEKVRFFLDQESGIRAAFLSAFIRRVKDRTADAFYVRINKNLTVNERRREKAKAEAAFDQARHRFPGLNDHELQIELIKERIAQVRTVGRWSDRWLLHPFPNMSEPDKAACYLTDLGDYSSDHLARLYQLASLHAIDRFFMQIRRRISLLERPIATASGMGRVWHGYSPYNPEVVGKMLSIFRVFYNYSLAGDDKKTPAMRLGLVDRVIDIDELLAFVPHAYRAL